MTVRARTHAGRTHAERTDTEQTNAERTRPAHRADGLTAVLEQLGHLSIHARQAIESLLAGQHRSVRRGLAVEFAGHRPYQPGDDLRRLDWLVYARSDRFVLRLDEEETRLRATVVVDVSGSMAFGDAGPNHAKIQTKLQRAREIAAVLAFLLVQQNDAVGLALCDDDVRELLPAQATRAQLLTMLDRLERAAAIGRTGLPHALATLARRLPRRGVVVVLTDGDAEPAAFGAALAALRHRTLEVRVIQILAAAEATFAAVTGMTEFVDLENGARVRVDADRVRPLYLRALTQHQAQLAAHCHAHGVRFDVVRTDADLTATMARLLGPPGATTAAVTAAPARTP